MNFRFASPDTERAARRIVALVREAGGRAQFVGGAVRDAVLGKAAEDVDIEVYGLEPERLLEVLRREFRLDLVGEAFGVIKIHGHPIDVSLPRTESKRGLGHRGFLVHSDPHLDPRDAARRRDFTINALAYDPDQGRLLDFFGGEQDLRDRVLRHVSEAFSEDPLRVLRGMQLIARFDLNPAPETVALCRTIDPEGLAPERMFEEWRKLILRGRRISAGLAFLRDTGWVRHYPELEALIDCPQEPEWHPEGDVWIHTLHCMDAFAEERIGDDWEDLVVGFGVLCHDLGKPAATVHEGGRWRSPRHEPLGEAPTRSFLGRLTGNRDLVEEVVPLVLHHLRPHELYRNQASDAAVRRLARAVGRIDRLVRVARADQRGRPPRPFDGFPAGEWLLRKAEELRVRDSAPRPILQGRHLIALGREPGRDFGRILEQCYEAQIEGAFHDEESGMAYLRKLLERKAADGG